MPKTILIVEDEAIIAMDMEASFTDLGHRVLLAVDIVSATRAIDDNRIDAAVLDWHLRGGSSTPIGELLKSRRIPFVLCSGSTFNELAEVFRDVPFVGKPFDETELMQAIEGLPPAY